MLEGDSDTSDTVDGEGPRFDPSTVDAGELFAVLDTSLLAAAVDVFDPTEAGAQLWAEAGEGICLKTRTENRYYVEFHLRTGQLTDFQADDLNRPFSADALAAAVSDTAADRVALHGAPGEGLALRDGEAVYDIGASESSLGSDHTPIMTADKAANALSFTLDASRLQSLGDADSSADQVRIAADSDAETADLGFGEATEPVITVDEDEFVRTPARNLWVDEQAAERLVTRTAFETAVEPMRGAVMVGLAAESGVNFAYELDDGGATIWAKLDKTGTGTLG